VTGFRTSGLAAPERAGWGGADGHRDTTHSGAGPRLPAGRRRSVPHLVIGALLVVVCALGFALAAGSLDHRRVVLALARPVTAGHQLSGADLASVRVSAGAGVATIPAAARDSVVGRMVAVSLPAGALLARGELGPVSLPPGQAVVAVAVAPGQAPPGLAAGAHVALVRIPATGAAAPAAGSGGSSAGGASASVSGPAASWSGVVAGVETVANAQATQVVSVQLAETDAVQVAALPTGQVDLALVGGK